MALCKNEKKQKEEDGCHIRVVLHVCRQEPQALVGLKVLALGNRVVTRRRSEACWPVIVTTACPRGTRSWGLGCRHLPLAGLWGCGCCKARPSVCPSPSTCRVAVACPAPRA